MGRNGQVVVDVGDVVALLVPDRAHRRPVVVRAFPHLERSRGPERTTPQSDQLGPAVGIDVGELDQDVILGAPRQIEAGSRRAVAPVPDMHRTVLVEKEYFIETIAIEVECGGAPAAAGCCLRPLDAAVGAVQDLENVFTAMPGRRISARPSLSTSAIVIGAE